MKQPDNPLLDQVLSDYPEQYARMITEWSCPGPDMVWCMYSANYLFRVGSTRFAIDPMTPLVRVGGSPPQTIKTDLAPLQLVAITHDHSDHLSWELLNSIAESVELWIIPEWLDAFFTNAIPDPHGSVRFVSAGDVIEFGDVRITVFAGNHWEDQTNAKTGQVSQKGLPSLAYLIEGSGKRWLFPGDTRSFNSTNRIPFGPVDLVVAHVFLGRLEYPGDIPPLQKQFCNFFAGYKTNRLILTHLYEVGRDTKDIWTGSHATSIQETINQLAPSIQVAALITGDSLDW